jgi:ATP-dependent RNA helicase CshB
LKTQFEKFKLKPFLIEALTAQGFVKPTEIQERLIPGVMNGSSAIGKSQTGTGKTLAFLIPLIERIDPERNECQAIITAPTRELAAQIYQELLKLLPENDVYRARKVVGGTDKKRMISKLKNPPHIVVGTPGRIHDLIKEEALSVYPAAMLVVDEADQMLDMGFIEDVDQIAARMAENLQMLVFSATIPETLQPFLKKYMENPKFVQVKPEQAAAAEIEHVAIDLRHRDKNELLVGIANSINPYLAIVFANTKSHADDVAKALSEAGINVELLHGGLQPRERKQVMKKIERLECQFVVATDLASRGIDIKGVSHIINTELPQDLDFYVHRVGRTGRAGLSGTAITIYNPDTEEAAIQKLEKRGISFQFVDLKGGEFIPVKKRVKRKPQQVQPKASLPKPKRVKPGYKKKMRQQIEKINKGKRK